MDNGTGLLQSLSEQSSEIRAERDRIDALDIENKQRKDAYSSKAKSWDEELNSLTRKVRAGELFIGNVIQDYVLVHYNFYVHEDFPAKFQGCVENVTALLTRLSETKNFWYHKQEWSPRSDICELSFLKQPPYVITPEEIRLHADSSLSIRVESIFAENTYWAFFQTNPGKELVVCPEPSINLGSIPRFSSLSLETSSLEKLLQKNPVALAGFRKRLGLEISPDLQDQLKKYTQAAAATAMKVLEEQYHSVRKSDRRIQEIEAEYNSPQKVTDMFATHPVIPDAEPDPVMAAIMSYESRQDRDWALKSLATIIHNLDRTGLSSYNEPIELSIMSGEKKVYNLAEYSRYVRGILEIGHRKREKAA